MCEWANWLSFITRSEEANICECDQGQMNYVMFPLCNVDEEVEKNM